MNKKDVEREIRFHLVQIGRLMRECHSGGYLALVVKSDEGYLSCNNDYWEAGQLFPLNFSEFNVDMSPQFRYDGEVLAEVLRRWMREGCGENCSTCALNLSENDRDCVNFLIKAILEADWSGFTMTSDGMVEKRYVEEVE